MSKIKMPADAGSEGGPLSYVSYFLLTAYRSGDEGSLCGLVYKETIPFMSVWLQGLVTS